MGNLDTECVQTVQMMVCTLNYCIQTIYVLNKHRTCTKIATTFISIRLKHFSKQENKRIKRNRLQKKLSKLVHFNDQ